VLEKLLCLLGLTILFCPLFFQTIDVKQLVNLLNCKHRTGLAKVAVQCSADTFVVNQSLVLRINSPRRMLKIATFAKPENVCDLNQLLMKQVIECYLTDGRN
jgi:hypothetical protein